MKRIDPMYSTMLAELGQRTFDAAFEADFPLNGNFVSMPSKGKDYWYFDLPQEGGGKKRSYVGPKSDEEISRRIASFGEVKSSLKQNRRLVNSLLREGGLNGPEPFQGSIIEALAQAGLFRLRGVLVGSAAFGCYGGVLGVRLPTAALTTGDADLAQDFAISAEVMDSIPPVLDILKRLDPTFRPVPHTADKARVTAFQNSIGYRVEFLTGNRGSEDYIGKPSPMPALGGASAEPLRFLDFLLVDPIRTVLLHRNGVSVNVPAPERYAIHKLIVATRRQSDGVLKREKDILQAGLLIEAIVPTSRFVEFFEVYIEAYERGTAWQGALRLGFGMLPKERRAQFLEGFAHYSEWAKIDHLKYIL